jgi:cell division protease FtsH
LAAYDIISEIIYGVPGGKEDQLVGRFLKSLALYFVIAIIVITVVSSINPQGKGRTELSYSEFRAQLEAEKVASVRIIGDRSIEGSLKNGVKFSTYAPEDPQLVESLLAEGVSVVAEPEQPPPWWLSVIPNLLISVLLFGGLWLFFAQQMQGGNNRALSFGKSRARLHSEDRNKISFGDVAGLDEAKQELQEIVEFLRLPKKFVDLGAKIPKGVLLVGPPGTGKTLLARAVAGEAGVPFFSISGSDFVEMFVGVGAARVRDLFETAKKNSPCIVFIDEIDAVGRQRGAGLGGGHDEREQTLNQLLVEMDGFDPNVGIIIVAATNRPDVLDPALLRPGRFDRQVIVDNPDVSGREAILKIHARNKPLARDVDLAVLARRTPGFTGADLENLMNEAAILTARKGKKSIEMNECEEAIDRVIMGPERKTRVISEQDRKVFAYHEAGHALVAKELPKIDPVHKVSIVSRGMAGGYTMVLPMEDKHVTTRSELTEYLAYALGGRAAEELAFEEISTGDQNDLERATKLARKMITEYGMSERLGPLTFGHGHEDKVFLGRDISRERNYSEEVAAIIDQEVRTLVESAYERAKSILKQERYKLEKIVAALLERETLNRDEFEALFQDDSPGGVNNLQPSPA